MQAHGAQALTEGLSAFPVHLTRLSVVPLAYWKTERVAYVTFVAGSPNTETHFEPELWLGRYDRQDDGWIAGPGWTGAPGWGGPEGPLGLPDGMEGKAVRWGGRLSRDDTDEGGPLFVIWGWCSAEVAKLVLLQGDDVIFIPINGHIRSWIIGNESNDPWRIEAHDSAGTVVGVASKTQGEYEPSNLTSTCPSSPVIHVIHLLG
jgi:hypothetical protein